MAAQDQENPAAAELDGMRRNHMNKWSKIKAYIDGVIIMRRKINGYEPMWAGLGVYEGGKRYFLMRLEWDGPQLVKMDFQHVIEPYGLYVKEAEGSDLI